MRESARASAVASLGHSPKRLPRLAVVEQQHRHATLRIDLEIGLRPLLGLGEVDALGLVLLAALLHHDVRRQRAGARRVEQCQHVANPPGDRSAIFAPWWRAVHAAPRVVRSGREQGVARLLLEIGVAVKADGPLVGGQALRVELRLRRQSGLGSPWPCLSGPWGTRRACSASAAGGRRWPDRRGRHRR